MRDNLRHVLWIGGSTDAGKTSVARMLAERHGWQEYHYDLLDRFEPPGHWSRIDPARQPLMHAMRGKGLDDTWVNTTSELMAEEWLASTPERFTMTLDDLLALPPSP